MADLSPNLARATYIPSLSEFPPSNELARNAWESLYGLVDRSVILAIH